MELLKEVEKKQAENKGCRTAPARPCARGVSPSLGVMPGLDQGFHPAQSVVYGYRREAVQAILAVNETIKNPDLSLGLGGDDFFHILALQMESAVVMMRKYLDAKAAGSRKV